MTQQKSIKINFVYNIIIQALQIIAPLIITPYVSRILGVANIGTYSYVNANTSYFLLLSVLGMSTYAQLQGARVRDNKKELGRLFSEVVLTRIITVTVTICVFLVFICIQKDYTNYYLIQIITISAGAFDFIWLFQAVEDFRTVTIRTAIVKGITIACVFLFVKDANDLGVYFFIIAIGTFIGNISVIPLLKRYIKLERPRKGYFLLQLENTFIYFLPTIAVVLTSTVDKQMLGIFYSEKIESGYYEQAYYIENAIYTLFIALNYTMRPRMSYLFAQGKIEEVNRRMNKSIEFVLFSSIPLALAVGILSKTYIPWFLGDQYLPVCNILKVMIFWIIFKAISSCFIEQNIVPKGGQLLASKIVWAGTISNICLNIYFIREYAAVGAAIASAISEFLILIIAVFCSRDSVNVKMILKKTSVYVLSSLPMALILLMLSERVQPTFLMTLLLVIIGALVYIIIMLLQKNEVVLEMFGQVKRLIKK